MEWDPCLLSRSKSPRLSMNFLDHCEELKEDQHTLTAANDPTVLSIPERNSDHSELEPELWDPL